MLFKQVLWVALGSGAGGAIRFLLSKVFPATTQGVSFPFSTFITNIIGCFLIGFVLQTPAIKYGSTNMRLLLTTGFCGGFTTFSTYIYEGYSIRQDNSFFLSLLYLIGSLIVGIISMALGIYIAKILFLK